MKYILEEWQDVVLVIVCPYMPREVQDCDVLFTQQQQVQGSSLAKIPTSRMIYCRSREASDAVLAHFSSADGGDATRVMEVEC